MNHLHPVLIVAVALMTTASLPAAEPEVDLARLAQAAVGEDAAEASAAMAKLRAAGPVGLKAMFDVHQAAIARLGSGASSLAVLLSKQPQTAAPRSRLTDALDRVARQKDAWASGLYWYTDLVRAQAAAAAEGKPILSLRLLGNLDDEYSCANSRFFRTVLYADEKLSAYLRQNYILHWKSVRPVPRITIDYGDGRKLQCTITGNSIHYVLDARGRVIEAIPGLYGAPSFQAIVDRAAGLARALDRLPEARRKVALAGYHAEQASKIRRRWAADLKRVGAEVPAAKPRALDPAKVKLALQAQKRSPSKMTAEIPLLVAMLPEVDQLEKATDDALWKKLAALREAENPLGARSRKLMRAKHPRAAEAMRVAVTKAKVEDPMLRVIARFQKSVAEDTVRNEYQLHRQIHQWLATADELASVDQLNDRIYAQLFLTPGADPWMGLTDPDIYTALPGRGLVKSGG